MAELHLRVDSLFEGGRVLSQQFSFPDIQFLNSSALKQNGQILLNKITNFQNYICNQNSRNNTFGLDTLSGSFILPSSHY